MPNLDTAAKRRSAIAGALPFFIVGIAPSGNDNDTPVKRQAATWQYAGVSPGSPSVFTPDAFSWTLYIDRARSHILYIDRAQSRTVYIDRARSFNLEW